MLNFSRTVLGIELGTTRIKAVLLDENHAPVASGSHVWENRLENGIWTYSLEDIVGGVQSCYADLRTDIRKRTGEDPTTFGAIGVSAMMHGYLPLDKTGVPLAPFRTWRNTVTGEASEKLTELFRFHIPQRWTIAHLYQSMLSGEEHVARIGYLTTLAGYVHWRLTGEKKVGLGEASGIFPLDSETLGYDAKMTEAFEALPETKKYPWRLADILPEPVPAGEIAGYLTEAGARFLDPTGTLQAGIPVAPCEGDAGTGILVKRVIGLPGDTVSIQNGYVYINGEKLEESYLPRQGVTAAGNQEEYVVPEGCLFFLGDNRTNSQDARLWDNPYIPVDKVRSHVLVCISFLKENSWRGIRVVS